MATMRMRTRATAVFVTSALVVLAACDASEREVGEEAGEAAAAAGEPGTPGGTATGQDTAGAGGEVDLTADTVEVSLGEYAIDMPGSLPAGRTVFRVTNTGGMEHGFEVEMGDVEAVLEPTAAPGETRFLTVDLTPGTWEVYCPVGDHADRGMRLDLTVS